MPSGEDDLIARYFRPLATHAGALGLIDDAAFLSAGTDDLVVTTDAVVEGVHFLADDPPDTVARKALRVNLSDLAAKGAEPAGFLLTLALPHQEERWLASFAQALGEDTVAFSCPLLGGDTVSTSGPAMISITAFGRVPKGRMVRRDGMKAGDVVAVTGTIGDAALGLALLQGRLLPTAFSDLVSRDWLARRYRVPQPRNSVSALVREYANAAMDVSDGLAGDVTKLCKASGVSADIRLADVPLSPAARQAVEVGAADLTTLIAGGDDYEVLCAVPENRFTDFEKAVTGAGASVTAIGIARSSVSFKPRFIDSDGSLVTLERFSYSHF